VANLTSGIHQQPRNSSQQQQLFFLATLAFHAISMGFFPQSCQPSAPLAMTTSCVNTTLEPYQPSYAPSKENHHLHPLLAIKNIRF